MNSTVKLLVVYDNFFPAYPRPSASNSERLGRGRSSYFLTGCYAAPLRYLITDGASDRFDERPVNPPA